MSEFDISEAKSLVAAGQFELLKGKIENEWLECKGELYQIHTDYGKRELAKDVSSFGNRSGGLIFIGIKTQKSIVHFGDEIIEIRPLEQALVDIDQYRNVIKEWIFPEPDAIAISWHEVASFGKGVFIIDIPPQPEEKRPYLIRRTIEEKKNVEILFGYAERKKANSQPFSIEQIHSLVRLGLGYERIVGQRFTGIESQIQAVLSSQTPTQATPPPFKIEDLLKQPLQDARRAAGIWDTKFIFLGAAPEPVSQVEGIFGSQLKGIRWLVEHPPTLRPDGWDIETGTPSQIVKGKLLRTFVPERKVLELHKNGAALFSARADQDFLCWGSESGRIHPVALMESVFNFLSFYQQAIPHMLPQPEFVHVVLGMVNLQVHPVNHLVPYGIKSIPFVSNASGAKAPENIFETGLRVPTVKFVPEKAAYDLIKELYLWFGYEESKMPYVARQGDTATVDIAQFKSL